jgi:hypothetical protein
MMELIGLGLVRVILYLQLIVMLSPGTGLCGSLEVLLALPIPMMELPGFRLVREILYLQILLVLQSPGTGLGGSLEGLVDWLELA